MKRPSFQFYPGDWLRDMGLRTCSSGARGLWIDMICYMHQGTPYGFLKVGAKVILPPNLAAMVGATLPEIEGWLEELESAEVFARDESGAIYSPRMIRDEELRNKRAEGGKKGGNPALMNNRKDNGEVNLEENENQTPSSSSSPSSSLFSFSDPTESAPPPKATRARHVSQDSIRWTRETKWTGITEQDRNDWKAAFPACDINRQLATMDAWLAANPVKAKKSNWRKFVTTWLTRSQDRGGDIASNKPRANGCL